MNVIWCNESKLLNFKYMHTTYEYFVVCFFLFSLEKNTPPREGHHEYVNESLGIKISLLPLVGTVMV